MSREVTTRTEHGDSERAANPAGAAPGKRTLTSQLPPSSGASVVQQRPAPTPAVAGASTDDPYAMHLLDRDRGADTGDAPVLATAQAGVAGPAQALPHADAIQRSFGRHEVGGIEAHVGGAAGQAAGAMGATAYATGNSVAFRDAPDLHTAAHEAAHVVQQRAGVSFRGLGRSGDAYEVHADRVADAVVGGRSAEPLLDEMAGRGGDRTAVQRRDDPAAGAGAAAAGAEAKPASRVAELAKKVGSAAGLRAALAADPSLAREIPAYLATQDDQALNALMAAAFPRGAREDARAGGAAAARPGGVKAKNPSDPTVALPADRTGDKALAKGKYKWTLHAVDHSRAKVDADFKPDESKVDAKAVSFVQTIIQKAGPDRVYPGGTKADPTKEKATYEPFEEPTDHVYVDHYPKAENDPFYGAQWDQASKSWVAEVGFGTVGSSNKGTSSTSATMNDTPNLGPVAREGKGEASSQFETVPVVLETREPLGALKWGFKIKDEENAPIELTGGEDADCTDAPSATWGAALDKFYEAKFETILDDFAIAKADLKPDHKTKLDGVVTKMTANASLKVQLGGACDHTGDEAFNQALALKRAEAARDYLTSKGIDAARIEVQSYSFDWARVEAAKGASEGKNRRVQVWLR